jgi:hypothetical protein
MAILLIPCTAMTMMGLHHHFCDSDIEDDPLTLTPTLQSLASGSRPTNNTTPLSAQKIIEVMDAGFAEEIKPLANLKNNSSYSIPLGPITQHSSLDPPISSRTHQSTPISERTLGSSNNNSLAHNVFNTVDRGARRLLQIVRSDPPDIPKPRNSSITPVTEHRATTLSHYHLLLHPTSVILTFNTSPQPFSTKPTRAPTTYLCSCGDVAKAFQKILPPTAPCDRVRNAPLTLTSLVEEELGIAETTTAHIDAALHAKLPSARRPLKPIPSLPVHPTILRSLPPPMDHPETCSIPTTIFNLTSILYHFHHCL